MVHFSPSIQQQKRFIIAKPTIWVWCSYNKRTKCLHIYRCFLTNRLNGKAAELCLVKSGNNRVTTTKYMSTLIASTAHITLSCGASKVLL